MPHMIDDLMNPALFPDRTEGVSLVQTHISNVFVGDRTVYKVKKAVNFGFLDFSTLEMRLHYCRQELKLNRRLSKDLYLGVLPIRFDGEHYRIGEGRGEVVEYAVKMKRIPDDMLMKSVFGRGQLRTEHLRDIARVLSQFHREAERSPEIDRFGQPEMFKVNTDENFEQTEKYIGRTVERDDFRAINEWTNAFFKDHRDLFSDRITQGKIRDCHGDLHMEHICLMDPIAIFDCIEFNDRFRYSDTISDIAFLLMDLEYHDGKEHADKLWELYGESTGDRGMESLLTFYKVYRAYVRGKVNSFQLDDEQIGSEEKERVAGGAKKYFKLARSYFS